MISIDAQQLMTLLRNGIAILPEVGGAA